MTKYVEINGKRHNLNRNGDIETFDGVILSSFAISHFGLEIKEDAPKWAIVSTLDPHTPLAHGDYLGHAQKVPTDYATGLELLVRYAKFYESQAFELRKTGVVVATLKGENA